MAAHNDLLPNSLRRVKCKKPRSRELKCT